MMSKLCFFLLFLPALLAAQGNVRYHDHYDLLGFSLNTGDSIGIGEPSGDKFRFIYSNSVGIKSRYGKEIANQTAVINRIFRVFVSENNFQTFIQIETRDGNKLKCEIVKAIDSGEIVSRTGGKIKLQRTFPYIASPSIFLSETESVTEGETVLLGPGTLPNGDYKFISVERGKGDRLKGQRLKVVDVEKAGSDRVGYKYMAILKGELKNYKCDTENAYLSGELAFEGYVSKQSGTDTPKIKTSIADEIKKLKELKDQGIITEEEFQQGKQKLLSQ